MADESTRYTVPFSSSRQPDGESTRKPAPVDQIIDVTVILRPAELPADDSVAVQPTNSEKKSAAQSPNLPNKDAEPMSRPTDDHIKQVQDFAEQNGLKVLETSTLAPDLVLQGSVGKMNKAFGIELEEVSYEGQTWRSHQGDISIPKALKDIIVGVIGLDDVPFFAPTKSLFASSARGVTAFELAKHYNFPPGATGRGYRVAILCFGGGYYPEDIDSYFSKFELKAPKINEISVLGAENKPLKWVRLVEMTKWFKKGMPEPNPFQQWEMTLGQDTLETTMDIQVAGSVANEAEIDVYFAPSTAQGFAQAIYHALAIGENRLPLAAISISWGTPEVRVREANMECVQAMMWLAAGQRVTVCCASGDWGSLDEPPSAKIMARVNFPASSPCALACGGSSWDSTDPASEEIVWNSKDAAAQHATGGGVSGYFGVPAQQQSENIPDHKSLNGNAWLSTIHDSTFKGRGVPDVAAHADVNGGYVIYIGGERFVTGGTSCATPLWAGLLACLGEKLGRPVPCLNELIYQDDIRSALRPIATGNNRIELNEEGAAFFSAGSGWNGCCGLGVPDGQALLACLAASLGSEPAT